MSWKRDDLRVSQHEPWSAEKHNATVALARAAGLNAGPGVFVENTPLGTLVSYDGEDGGAASSSPWWRASLGMGPGEVWLTMEQGYIADIPATIGGVKLGANPAPKLILTPAHFDASGEARIYARVDISRAGWTATAVEVVASATRLDAEAWKGHTLLGIVAGGIRNPRYVRFCWTNQHHLVIQRRDASGIGNHLFWVKT